MSTHLSDCALHDGPAHVPGPCSCGANPGQRPDATTSEWPLDPEATTLPHRRVPLLTDEQKVLRTKIADAMHLEQSGGWAPIVDDVLQVVLAGLKQLAGI